MFFACCSHCTQLELFKDRTVCDACNECVTKCPRGVDTVPKETQGEAHTRSDNARREFGTIDDLPF